MFIMMEKQLFYGLVHNQKNIAVEEETKRLAKGLPVRCELHYEIIIFSDTAFSIGRDCFIRKDGPAAPPADYKKLVVAMPGILHFSDQCGAGLASVYSQVCFLLAMQACRAVCRERVPYITPQISGTMRDIFSSQAMRISVPSISHDTANIGAGFSSLFHRSYQQHGGWRFTIGPFFLCQFTGFSRMSGYPSFLYREGERPSDIPGPPLIPNCWAIRVVIR
jgi:hypothetical protein